jgi:glutamyl-tRNA synthetase
MTVRTRIAPSPTGAPHIGTAYIALFNYAFAKHHGGQFVLRIEDTDQVRSTQESEDAILEALQWVGLPWDEGPDCGGDYGPYRQSERTEIYQEHCRQLVDAGKAYPCFCTSERLTALRQQQEADKADRLGYDGHCAQLDPAAAQERIAAGEAHVIRLRVPSEGECRFKDRLRDPVSIPWNTIDDQVLLKTDGFPTYHLANVVDDHLMEISHVIRGEEWISSTPKHILLYEAFGWEPPEFAHLPLLRNPDKSKLSKRKNPTSILYYRQAGFLPEALVNFLGLMAYSPADGEETFTLAKMAETFDLDRVSLGGPIFDLQKLQAFNGRYIRDLSSDALLERLKLWMMNDETILKLAPLAQQRLNQLADFVPMTAFVYADRLTYDPELLLKGVEAPERAPALLRIAQWEIERMPTWDADCIKDMFMRISEKEDLKFKKLLSMFFVAISGSAVSLPLFDTMVVIGRDMSLRRVQYAITALEQVDLKLSGKALKKLTKDYDYRYSRGN